MKYWGVRGKYLVKKVKLLYLIIWLNFEKKWKIVGNMRFLENLGKSVIWANCECNWGILLLKLELWVKEHFEVNLTKYENFNKLH